MLQLFARTSFIAALNSRAAPSNHSDADGRSNNECQYVPSHKVVLWSQRYIYLSIIMQMQCSFAGDRSSNDICLCVHVHGHGHVRA